MYGADNTLGRPGRKSSSDPVIVTYMHRNISGAANRSGSCARGDSNSARKGGHQRDTLISGTRWSSANRTLHLLRITTDLAVEWSYFFTTNVCGGVLSRKGGNGAGLGDLTYDSSHNRGKVPARHKSAEQSHM